MQCPRQQFGWSVMMEHCLNVCSLWTLSTLFSLWMKQSAGAHVSSIFYYCSLVWSSLIWHSASGKLRYKPYSLVNNLFGLPNQNQELSSQDPPIEHTRSNGGPLAVLTHHIFHFQPLSPYMWLTSPQRYPSGLAPAAYSSSHHHHIISLCFFLS